MNFKRIALIGCLCAATACEKSPNSETRQAEVVSKTEEVTEVVENPKIDSGIVPVGEPKEPRVIRRNESPATRDKARIKALEEFKARKDSSN